MLELILIVLLTVTPADAKTKTARSRVSEVFSLLAPAAKKPLPRGVLPLRAAPYLFHHDIYFYAGKRWKGFQHRECPYDRRNDPGDASCVLVWAEI